MNNKIILLCGLLVLLGNSSCLLDRRFFEPAVQPAHLVKSALIRTPGPIYRNNQDLIIIKSINGEPPVFLDTKAVVPPGMTTAEIDIELQRPTRSGKKFYIIKANTLLTFEAVANQEYMVDADANDDGPWIWVTDVKTNQVVAGEAPQELLPEDFSVH